MTWYDDNARISYPLTGADDGLVPQDVLVDVLVHIPASLGTAVTVSSVVVTELVVSVVLGVAGAPVAYVTVPNAEDLVYATTALIPIASGVEGFIVFGPGIRAHRLNLSGSYPLMDECVVIYPGDPSVPTLVLGTVPFYGIPVLQAGSDITITAEDVVVQGVGTVRAAVFRLAAAVRGDPVSSAYKSAEAALRTPAVRSINGIPAPVTFAVKVIKALPGEADVTLVPDAGNHAIAFVDAGVPCATVTP